MTDVLKLAEEALERASTLLVATRDFIEANPVSEYTVVFDEAECDGGCLRDDVQTCNEWQVKNALTALRAARAEWGWRLLSDLGRAATGDVTVGRWLDGKWVTREFNCYADIIVGLGYTHYAVPQLPTPPAREEVRNG